MPRRSLVATLAAGLLSFTGARAEAAGAWLSSDAIAPAEQRVAVAVGPQRVTLWTSLRFTATGGRVAIVVPAPPGSALDVSSDAWFEALEVATAPRVFPPADVDPFCPGKSGSPNVFELDGQVGHTASLTPKNVAVLDTAAQVASWAAQQGLTIAAPTEAALGTLTGVRFIALAFDAPTGAGLTPTLRVSMPSAPAALPLALTRAAGEDLRVTAWAIGPGRGDLIGAAEVLLTPGSIKWNAKDSRSDLDDHRTSLLASDPSRFLVEAASHEALSQAMSIAAGTASIDAVVSTYFERAAAYGDGSFDSAACLALAEPALMSSAPVAAVCPLAGLGVVAPAPTCSESSGPSEIDPGKLRCGPGADDLAVALSGAAPASAWITRQALVIPAGGAGLDWPIGFTPGAAKSPVIQAGSVDYGDCDPDGGAPDGGSSSSSSGGSSSSSSSSGHASSGGYVHDYGEYPGGGGVEIDLDALASLTDALYEAGCSCSGPDVSSSYEPDYVDDGCSSDGYSSADSCSADATGDSCSGDGTGDSCSGDGVDTESCDAGSAGDSCDSGGGGEACDGADFGEACDVGGGSGSCDFGDCTTARTRKRGPRFSILLVCALAVIAPLRRRGRRSRDAERAARLAGR